MIKPIQPGATIGILGGGQLGRLLCAAAAKLGYKTHVYCPEENCPASLVSSYHTCEDYTNLAAIDKFSQSIDVATCEFENIPSETVNHLSQNTLVHPSWKALNIAQSRKKEKIFFSEIGAATAPWKPIANLKDLLLALNTIKTPALLKTNKFGYDGKGQVLIESIDAAENAWLEICPEQHSNNNPEPHAILEGFVNFSTEISVIAARSETGRIQCFEPAENIHKNQVLHTTNVPAKISSTSLKTAINIAERAANALELIGLIAVEMFVTDYGGIIVNEMAPRPHNSGHWTLDACQTDQFTQLVRAICGLPLLDPRRHSDAIMTNIFGSNINNLEKYYSNPNCNIWIYGKSEPREGRKMGHITETSAKTLGVLTTNN